MGFFEHIRNKLYQDFGKLQYMLTLKCAITVWYKTDRLFYIAQAMTDILNLVQGAPLQTLLSFAHILTTLSISKFA